MNTSCGCAHCPSQNVIAKFGTIDGAVDGYRALLLGPTTPRNAVDAWKAAVRSDTVPTRVVEVRRTRCT